MIRSLLPAPSASEGLSDPSLALGAGCSLAERDDHLGRHARFEDALRVVDLHADAEDLMAALVDALDVARRELALAVDLHDLALEAAVAEAVDGDVDLLTEF